MQSDTANCNSYRLSLDRAKCFITTASFPLAALSFEQARALDGDKVNTLRGVFRAGFYPERVEHRIPAIVPRTDLQEGWFSRGEEFPKCRPPNGYKINCLHGRHRVKAAEEEFGPNSTWVLDLYDTGISPNTERSFIEHYVNEKPPDGGELFYNIRKYKGRSRGHQVNRAAGKWWQALCSENQLQAINRLNGHEEIMVQLDRLHPLKALHPAMKLGSIGRLISLSWEEGICNALELLRVFWWDVFDNDEQAMEKFSAESLAQLVGLAPGANETQRKSIQRDIIAQRIFGEFADNEGNRKGLAYFTRIVANTTKNTIPSLDVVFKNLVYFERAALNIKQLLPPLRRGQSIREALHRHFSNVLESESLLVAVDGSNMNALPDTGCRWIQTDALTLQLFECQQDRFDLFVRQIWAAALRTVDSKPPSKNSRTPGSETDIGNPYALQQLAMLAHRLGFESRESKALRTGSPDQTMAGHVLRLSLRPGHFYEPDELDPITERLACEMYRAREDAQKLKQIDQGIQGRGGGKPFGMPSKEDFQRDWPNMFLHKLHGTEHMEEFGASVSSFFVARSLYLSVLGGNEIRLGRPLPGYKLALGMRSSVDPGTVSGSLQNNTASETELRQENAKLTSDIAELNKLVQCLKDEGARLNDKKQNVETELIRENAKLKLDIAELHKQNLQTERDNSRALTDTTNSLGSQVIELKRLLNAERVSVRSLQDEVARLEMANKKMQTDLDDLAPRLYLKNSELDGYQSLKSTHEALKKDLQTKTAKLETMEAVLEMHRHLVADLEKERRTQGVRFLTTSAGRLPDDIANVMCKRGAEALKGEYKLYCHVDRVWKDVSPSSCYRLALENRGVIIARHKYETVSNIGTPDFYGSVVPSRPELPGASAMDKLLQERQHMLLQEQQSTDDTDMGGTSITICTTNGVEFKGSDAQIESFAKDLYGKTQGCLYCPVEASEGRQWMRVNEKDYMLAKENPCCALLLLGKEDVFPQPNLFHEGLDTRYLRDESIGDSVDLQLLKGQIYGKRKTLHRGPRVPKKDK